MTQQSTDGTYTATDERVEFLNSLIDIYGTPSDKTRAEFLQALVDQDAHMQKRHSGGNVFPNGMD